MYKIFLPLNSCKQKVCIQAQLCDYDFGNCEKLLSTEP